MPFIIYSHLSAAKALLCCRGREKWKRAGEDGKGLPSLPNILYYCYFYWNTQREFLRRRVYRSGEAFTSLQPESSLQATLNRDYLGSASIDDWELTSQLKRYMVFVTLTWKAFYFKKAMEPRRGGMYEEKLFVTVFSFSQVHSEEWGLCRAFFF